MIDVDLPERAVLGAAMLDPNSAATAVRLLRASDFLDPWHGAVFRMIRDRVAAGQPTDTNAVGLGLIDRLGHRRADLVRLTKLIAITPVQPQVCRYASMVLNAALRREIG